MCFEACCCVLSLQIGVALLSAIFMTISITSIVVNISDFGETVAMACVLAWCGVFMLCATVSFMGAFKESKCYMVTAVHLFVIVFVTWAVATTLSFFMYKNYLCVHNRCGESFWITAYPYRANENRTVNQADSSYEDLFGNQTGRSNDKGMGLTDEPKIPAQQIKKRKEDGANKRHPKIFSHKFSDPSKRSGLNYTTNHNDSTISTIHKRKRTRRTTKTPQEGGINRENKGMTYAKKIDSITTTTTTTNRTITAITTSQVNQVDSGETSFYKSESTQSAYTDHLSEAETWTTGLKLSRESYIPSTTLIKGSKKTSIPTTRTAMTTITTSQADKVDSAKSSVYESQSEESDDTDHLTEAETWTTALKLPSTTPIKGSGKTSIITTPTAITTSQADKVDTAKTSVHESQITELDYPDYLTEAETWTTALKLSSEKYIPTTISVKKSGKPSITTPQTAVTTTTTSQTDEVNKGKTSVHGSQSAESNYTDHLTEAETRTTALKQTRKKYIPSTTTIKGSSKTSFKTTPMAITITTSQADTIDKGKTSDHETQITELDYPDEKDITRVEWFMPKYKITEKDVPGNVEIEETSDYEFQTTDPDYPEEEYSFTKPTPWHMPKQYKLEKNVLLRRGRYKRKGDLWGKRTIVRGARVKYLDYTPVDGKAIWFERALSETLDDSHLFPINCKKNHSDLGRVGPNEYRSVEGVTEPMTEINKYQCAQTVGINAVKVINKWFVNELQNLDNDHISKQLPEKSNSKQSIIVGQTEECKSTHNDFREVQHFGDSGVSAPLNLIMLNKTLPKDRTIIINSRRRRELHNYLTRRCLFKSERRGLKKESDCMDNSQLRAYYTKVGRFWRTSDIRVKTKDDVEREIKQFLENTEQSKEIHKREIEEQSNKEDLIETEEIKAQYKPILVDCGDGNSKPYSNKEVDTSTEKIFGNDTLVENDPDKEFVKDVVLSRNSPIKDLYNDDLRTTSFDAVGGSIKEEILCPVVVPQVTPAILTTIYNTNKNVIMMFQKITGLYNYSEKNLTNIELQTAFKPNIGKFKNSVERISNNITMRENNKIVYHLTKNIKRGLIEKMSRGIKQESQQGIITDKHETETMEDYTAVIEQLRPTSNAESKRHNHVITEKINVMKKESVNPAIHLTSSENNENCPLKYPIESMLLTSSIEPKHLSQIMKLTEILPLRERKRTHLIKIIQGLLKNINFDEHEVATLLERGASFKSCSNDVNIGIISKAPPELMMPTLPNIDQGNQLLADLMTLNSVDYIRGKNGTRRRRSVQDKNIISGEHNKFDVIVFTAVSCLAVVFMLYAGCILCSYCAELYFGDNRNYGGPSNYDRPPGYNRNTRAMHARIETYVYDRRGLEPTDSSCWNSLVYRELDETAKSTVLRR